MLFYISLSLRVNDKLYEMKQHHWNSILHFSMIVWYKNSINGYTNYSFFFIFAGFNVFMVSRVNVNFIVTKPKIKKYFYLKYILST